MRLKRRHFLYSGMALASSASLLGCGPALREVRTTALPAALQELQQLMRAPKLHSTTAWSWSKTLAHLAQSIEYSMDGYPRPSSTLFKTVVGQPAFAFFAWRGHMQHDLTEPIPGSPELLKHPPLDWATFRLFAACQRFMQWQGPLKPHFAYGTLTHAEYEQAHAMHLANHFAAFYPA